MMKTTGSGMVSPSPYSRKVDTMLIPGKIAEDHFSVLIELSPIRSKKIVYALHDHLVEGVSRNVACGRHGASISYFSVSLGRLFYIHQLVSQLMPFYREEKTNIGVTG